MNRSLHLGWIGQAVVWLAIGFLTLRFLTWLSWAFVIAASFGWLLAFACIAHARRPFAFSREGRWIVDILDRLCDAHALRQALQGQPAAGPLQIDIDAPALAAQLKAKLFGQDAVCDDIAREVRRRAARTGRSTPLGVFFLAGPPATGKTYLGKVLAAAMPAEFGTTFIECAQYSEAHTASALFGAPAGYIGSDKPGQLVGDLRSNPRRVIILDEFEKAAREVAERFLSAWNDGFLTAASGERVATVNAIFVVTTNAAQDDMAGLAKSYAGDRDGLSQACKRALAGHFSPPVLSRIDRVFPFLPLGDEDLARLVAGQIERNAYEFDLTLAEGGLDYRILIDAVRQARRQSADAREINRQIGRVVDDQLMAFKDRHRGQRRLRLTLTNEGEMQAVPA